MTAAKKEEASGALREWVVMLRARSSVRLLDDPHVLVAADAKSTVPVTAIRLRNGFFSVDGKLVFKGLIAEARGMAATPESAVALLGPLAAPCLQVAATAGNASVDEPGHLLVYAPPTSDDVGRFLEQRPCDVPLPAATVRSIAPADYTALVERLLGHPDEERLHRAMAHFRQAVRALDPFNRVMSAEHLYMACENLGQVVFRRLCREAGVPATGDSKHQFAVAAGFDPVGETRQHLNAYDSYLRIEHIFDGDGELYKTLRGASDAFEHGFGGFEDVQRKAHASADASFRCVRRAILREIGIAEDSGLLADKYDHALAGWSPALQVTGTYMGDPDKNWPYFYGASLIPEIASIDDLDGDQKRTIEFKMNVSGASLLEGQQLSVETTTWVVPATPDRQATRVGQPEIVMTRGDAHEA